MIAILIEPESVASARLARFTHATPIVPTNARSTPPGAGNSNQGGAQYWTEIILETLRIENGPMAITALVNSAAKWGDYNCRSDREQRKLQLFKLISTLIRTRLLDRYARNYVVIPATDEKRQAYVNESLGPADLPEPNV